MYKIVLLFFISNAALIYTQKDEEFNIYGENHVTTETYHSSYQEIAVNETNEDQQAEKTEVETEQNEDTKEAVIPIVADEVKTERATVLSQGFDLKKAEAELKAWAENLDCLTTSLGPLKCRMVKKLSKRLFEHTVLADIDFRKVAVHLRAALKKLEDGDKPMDTEFKNLIQKYKKYLYTDQAVPRK